MTATGSINPRQVVAAAPQPMPSRLLPRLMPDLAGRTLTVGSIEELVLNPGEVVLTFDDGPRPGKTEAILETLESYGVKATFFMLGSAAEQHPELVRRVALAGHTIGSHTYGHVNLARLSLTGAIAEIYAGQQAVAAALAPLSVSPSRFFRFPYLSQTGVVRAGAIDSNYVVVGVDIDSKDYYSDTPQTVTERTLAQLDERGGGIVLFHDIHARTVALLPQFLSELRARGYSVVTLRSSGSVFDAPATMAEAPHGATL